MLCWAIVLYLYYCKTELGQEEAVASPMTLWMKDPCLWNGFAQHTENSIGVDCGALISPWSAEPGVRREMERSLSWTTVHQCIILTPKLQGLEASGESKCWCSQRVQSKITYRTCWSSGFETLPICTQKNKKTKSKKDMWRISWSSGDKEKKSVQDVYTVKALFPLPEANLHLTRKL